MTAHEVPAEVEIKLEAAAADDLHHIAQLRRLGRFRLRRRGVHALHTIYLDTRDHALTRAGIALRLRRTGTEWEATAKWSGRVDGALHERPELTVALPREPALPFKLPDGPLHMHLAATVLGRRLTPILISDVQRQLRDLLPAEGPAGRSLAEVALDTVALQAPGGAAAVPVYHEVEIEQRAGSTDDLTELSHLLQERFGLIPSPTSKFVRGYVATYGTKSLTQGPAAIQAGDNVGAAARKIVALQLARLRAADPGTRLGERPESLHEMRVAVRRLRAALRTFADGIPAGLRRQLSDELRWLGQELGTVRDLDVQLANLAWHAHRRAPLARRRLEPFRRHLEQERGIRRAAVLVLLDSPRYFRLLGALERFAASPQPKRPSHGAVRPVGAVGRRAFRRAMRKVIKRGGAVGELPEADDLHALRIRAKRLRYLLEALAPISGKPGRKLIRKLVRLQDVLGRFNDSIVAATSVRAYRDAAALPAGDERRRLLTALADAELRRAGAAQADFARAWRRFTAKSAQRQRRRLLAYLEEAAEAPAGGSGTDFARVAEANR